MGGKALKRTIRRLLEFVDGTGGDPVGDERTLARLLDELALATHAAPPAPRTDLEAPPVDAAALRDRIAARFPRLGLYRALDLELEGTPSVGDAVDDLVDLARELRDVVWLWERVGEDDALARLHAGFATHWGAHLRQLQAYLQELAGAGAG